MAHSVSSMNTSFHHCLMAYTNIVIYGFGALGRDIYAHYREYNLNIIVVDRLASIDGVNIVRPEALNIDNSWLVINTVLDAVENGKVSSEFRSRWPMVNLMSCRDHLILTADQEKICRFQSTLPSSGYLQETGWLNAFCSNRSIDQSGSPIPWVTYAFIAFIEPRLHHELKVFEFGAGSSTQWFAKRVKSVTSVEHDEQWFNNINAIAADNIDIHFQSLEYGGAYSNFALQCSEKFDVIMVDGRDRVNCIMNACCQLTENGVLVLDDAEREKYQSGITWLLNSGFKRLDFWGIAPGVFNNKCTTIFYRDDNCIGI